MKFTVLIYTPNMNEHKLLFTEKFFYQSKTLDFLKWFKEKLEKMNVVFFENELVNSVEIKEKHASCNGVKADLLIFANGVYPRFLKNRQNMEYLTGLEYTVEGADVEEKHFFRVYLDSNISPGYGSWIMPINETTVHVGLLKYMKDKISPKSSMEMLFKKIGFKFSNIIETRCGVVPVSGPVEKTYGDRYIIVGDAAGQVGAFSCGGIHYAFEVGRIVGEIIPKYIDFPSSLNLSAYQKMWQNKIGGSLNGELTFRKIFDRMDSNQKLEMMFKILKIIPDKKLTDIAVKHCNFESTDMINFIMKNPLVRTFIGKIFNI